MAAAVLVTVSYSVRPEKHNEFKSLIAQIVNSVNGSAAGVRLSVYQSDAGDTSYMEVYECDSSDAYDRLEDTLDDNTQNSMNTIASDFVTSRQSFTTLKKIAG